MRNRKQIIVLEILVGFLINLAAGYFLLIYAVKDNIEKINAFISCIGCLYIAYKVKSRLKRG